MKNFFILLFTGLLLVTTKSYSQQNDNSAFGAPVIKFTSLVGQSAVLVGGRFGWVINKSIVLGGGIYGLINTVNTNVTDPISGQNVMLGFNCGGLEFEYIFFHDEPIHASFDMLVGLDYNLLNHLFDLK